MLLLSMVAVEGCDCPSSVRRLEAWLAAWHTCHLQGLTGPGARRWMHIDQAGNATLVEVGHGMAAGGWAVHCGRGIGMEWTAAEQQQPMSWTALHCQRAASTAVAGCNRMRQQWSLHAGCKHAGQSAFWGADPALFPPTLQVDKHKVVQVS